MGCRTRYTVYRDAAAFRVIMSRMGSEDEIEMRR